MFCSVSIHSCFFTHTLRYTLFLCQNARLSRRFGVRLFFVGSLLAILTFAKTHDSHISWLFQRHATHKIHYNIIYKYANANVLRLQFVGIILVCYSLRVPFLFRSSIIFFFTFAVGYSVHNTQCGCTCFFISFHSSSSFSSVIHSFTYSTELCSIYIEIQLNKWLYI